MLRRENIASNASVNANATGAAIGPLDFQPNGKTIQLIASAAAGGTSSTLAYTVEASPDGTSNWTQIGATGTISPTTMYGSVTLTNVLAPYIRVKTAYTGANAFTGVYCDVFVG